MRKIICALTVAIISSLAVACMAEQGARLNELSRRKAAQLINNYPTFATTRKIELQSVGRARAGTGQDAGVVEGLWTIQKEGLFGATRLRPTEKGQKFFTNDLDLTVPAKREVVGVTGISDEPMAQNIKEADFKWRYENLPEIVARYTGQGKDLHDGKATLRLYDDGWRVLAVEVHETGRQPFVWSASLEQEADRQFRTAQEVEKNRLERIQRAKTPTRTIATYKGGCADDWRRELVITDTTVTMTSVELGQSNPPRILTTGYWQDLSMNPPRTYGFHCVELEGRIPIGSQNPGGFDFIVGEQDMPVLNRAYDQILQAQKEWREKYPDIQ